MTTFPKIVATSTPQSLLITNLNQCIVDIAHHLPTPALLNLIKSCHQIQQDDKLNTLMQLIWKPDQCNMISQLKKELPFNQNELNQYVYDHSVINPQRHTSYSLTTNIRNEINRDLTCKETNCLLALETLFIELVWTLNIQKACEIITTLLKKQLEKKMIPPHSCKSNKPKLKGTN